jgi:SPP1 gp7 family putative phage head morphogenesis protein
MREAFRSRLEGADREGGAWLRDVLRQDAGWVVAPKEIADGGAEADEAMARWDETVAVLQAEWGGQPARFDAAREVVEDHLVGTFSNRLNQRRQNALGIDQYRWVTQGDERVRSEHAELDGAVFDWDDQPSEGHPGADFNCRCHARPHLPDEPDWVPDTGLAHLGRRAMAEGAGAFGAGRDFLADVAAGLASLPAQAALVGRFARLLAEEAFGTMDADEARELAEMRAAVGRRLDEVVEALRDAPETAAAFRDYVIAVEDRVGMVDEAYRAGLATEADLLEAVEDRAYLETLILLNVAPASLLAHVVRRFPDHDGGGGSPAVVIGAGMARARRHPSDVDWPVIDNPGIAWGGGIVAQGDPWEKALDDRRVLGRRMPRTFRAFDFYDPATRTAFSAKTLDTQAPSYLARPSRVYGQLKRYVDQAAAFRQDAKLGQRLRSGDIEERVMILAVPVKTSPEQVMQIQRTIRYAADRDVLVMVEFVE